MWAPGVGPVDLGMTVCTPGVESLFKTGRRGTWVCKVSMPRVALQTEERFLIGEQIGEDGTVGVVTDHTVVGEVGMFKGEWADELPVAVDAEAFNIHRFDIRGVSRAVRIMAIGAKHNAIRNRVPG